MYVPVAVGVTASAGGGILIEGPGFPPHAILNDTVTEKRKDLNVSDYSDMLMERCLSKCQISKSDKKRGVHLKI